MHYCAEFNWVSSGFFKDGCSEHVEIPPGWFAVSKGYAHFPWKYMHQFKYQNFKEDAKRATWQCMQSIWLVAFGFF